MEIVSKGELKTGFAHIDRPWMQYYNIDGYEKVNTNQSIVDYMVEKTKAHKSKVEINYFGEKVKYGKLMKKINKAAHILKGIMREICDQGGCIFFSTHVLEVAERIVDRIGIIRKGELVFVGTIEELKAKYNASEDSLEELFLELTK